ncbi:unnamed protein product [Dicrocoelium dendriticum]|nr:unnamed protein product [Dicrocoelium dendriticum]
MKMLTPRSGRYTIQSDGGQLIDLKTKQLLFFECGIETVRHEYLKSNEEFSQEGANTVYEKYHRRRQSKCILLCLTDRIRLTKRGALGSSPFRKQLMYREIKHFFVFPSNPGIFMLCTVDDKHLRKAYELYRCKPEDVNTISDLTYKASIDPQHVLRDTEYSRTAPVSPSYPTASQSSCLDDVLDKGSMEEMPSASRKATSHSITSSPGIVSQPSRSVQLVHARSMSVGVLSNNPPHDHTSFMGKQVNKQLNSRESQTSTTDVNELPVVVREHLVSPSLGSPVSHAHPEYLNLPKQATRERSSYTDEGRRQYTSKRVGEERPGKRIIIEREHASHLSTTNGDEANNWDDSVTYLQYNPTTGMKVTADGPIYMYIARFPSQHNLSSITPTSQTNVWSL